MAKSHSTEQNATRTLSPTDVPRPMDVSVGMHGTVSQAKYGSEHKNAELSANKTGRLHKEMRIEPCNFV